MSRPRPRFRDDRGDGDTAALMFLAPLAIGVALLFVLVGRQGASLEAVTHAAHVGARSASLERSTADAEMAGRTAVENTLRSAGTACEGGPDVSIRSSTWQAGGTVEVTVRCQVTTFDLKAIGAPSRSYEATSRAVIDTYRSFEP